MVSMQFSINYNPDLVTYTASTDHNLAGLGPANIANPSPGKITLSWVADDVFNGESVANCTSIVTLLFDGAGTTNDNYAFTSDPTVIEVSDVNGLVSPVLAVADCACGNSGLAQFELEGREITVFPNPMSANAQIEIMGETIQNGTCRMFNIVGQEVYTQLFSGNKLTIESNKLLAGTYFTAIYSDGVLIGVEKVIVK